MSVAGVSPITTPGSIPEANVVLMRPRGGRAPWAEVDGHRDHRILAIRYPDPGDEFSPVEAACCCGSIFHVDDEREAPIVHFPVPCHFDEGLDAFDAAKTALLSRPRNLTPGPR